MSFERTQYDPCAYKQDLHQSMRVGNYALETPARSCAACFSPDPHVRIQRGGGGAASCVPAALTDLDSEMMGLGTPLSRCPEQPARIGTCDASMPPECDSAPVTEATRISNPPCTLRGTGWNRWQWLHHDPQERCCVPFDTQIANRIIVKDNHRPCVHAPADQSALLPQPKQQQPEATHPPYATGRTLPMWHWRSAEEIRCL